MSEKIKIDTLLTDLKKLKTIGRLLSDKELSVEYSSDECGREIIRISHDFEEIFEALMTDDKNMLTTETVSKVPFPTDEYLVLSGKLLYSIRYYFTLLRDLEDNIDEKLYLKVYDISSQYTDFKIGNDLTDAINEILLTKSISSNVREFLESINRFNNNVKAIYAQISNGSPITAEYGHQEYNNLTEEKLVQYIDYVIEQGEKIKRIPRA